MPSTHGKGARFSLAGRRVWGRRRTNSSWCTGADGLGSWGIWAWASGEEMDGPSIHSSCFLPLSAQRWKGYAQAVDYQGEVQCKHFIFCSFFITAFVQTAKLHCGDIGDLRWFSCARGYEPHRKLLSLPGAFPWALPERMVRSSPTSLAASCPTHLLLPSGRSQTEPAMACGICKTHAPFPSSCEINCFVPLTCAVPTCGLSAHSLQRTSRLPFFPPFVWFLAEENYPPQELEEMQRMK